MRATVADILRIMDAIAPARLAEQWDNVGLQLGADNWPVRTIWTALDPGIEVVEAAVKNDVDLLITHHPLFFQPIDHIDFNTPEGRVIRRAATRPMAVIAAHTNLDSARRGLNDQLAKMIGLKNLCPLAPAPNSVDSRQEAAAPAGTGEGLGRVGDLDRAMDLASLASKIKDVNGIPSLRAVGPADLSVQRVAVCTGSGGGLLDYFFSSGAQVYVTGDLRYHDARRVEAAGRGALDMGHFASEHIMVELLARQLREKLSESDFTVEVKACRLENDPFIIY